MTITKLKTKPSLRVVKETHRPVVDIYATWREQIAGRDWEACHVRGDRSEAVYLPDRPKRGWFR